MKNSNKLAGAVASAWLAMTGCGQGVTNSDDAPKNISGECDTLLNDMAGNPVAFDLDIVYRHEQIRVDSCRSELVAAGIFEEGADGIKFTPAGCEDFNARREVEMAEYFPDYKVVTPPQCR